MPVFNGPRTAHGRGKPTALVPGWYPAAGQWGALGAGSVFQDSAARWTGTSPGGSDQINGIFTYSGGGLNLTGVYYDGAFHAEPALFVWGGGHSDTGSNEMQALVSLWTDTPQFKRLRDPTIPAPLNVARDASGNPVSRHTYSILQWLPTQNKMLSLGGGGRYSNANSLTTVDKYNFADNSWEALPDLTVAPAIDFGNAMGAFNPVTGKSWVLTVGNNTKLYCHDASNEAVTYYTVSMPDFATNSGAAIHPAQNFFVCFAASGAVRGMDLNAPASPSLLTTTGTGPSATNGLCITWDSDNSRFVVWAGDSTVYYLTPPSSSLLTGTWVWTSVVGGGVTPTAPYAKGTFNRMVHWPGKGGFLLLANATGQANFFRY